MVPSILKTSLLIVLLNFNVEVKASDPSISHETNSSKEEGLFRFPTNLHLIDQKINLGYTCQTYQDMKYDYVIIHYHVKDGSTDTDLETLTETLEACALDLKYEFDKGALKWSRSIKKATKLLKACGSEKNLQKHIDFEITIEAPQIIDPCQKN